MADHIQLPSIDLAMPGRLTADTRIRLHTRDARALVKGRPYMVSTENNPGQPGIIGLEGFGWRVARICQSAAADDPYADWALIRIEDVLRRAGQLIEPRAATIQAELEADPDLEIKLVESVDPIQVPILASHPYSMMAGRLLVRFDFLTRAVLTAQYNALMDTEKAQTARRAAGTVLRHVLAFPAVAWRYSGITRRDVRERTVLAQQFEAVAQHMRIPPLPADVLAGKRRGRYAPPIRRESARPTYLDEPDEAVEAGDERGNH